ncbi:hypothetical protein BCV70DRAFT_204063 [Testicularia cyperi]|uniref:Uncharacterized protein n=1 Tax=Testicularia cyperi TaxID=1882483 RepID=A0A317XY72_9BASI|nr:hypothetical protein BCV70DRAFT_204063 [Testicularia cyperi]
MLCGLQASALVSVAALQHCSHCSDFKSSPIPTLDRSEDKRASFCPDNNIKDHRGRPITALDAGRSTGLRSAIYFRLVLIVSSGNPVCFYLDPHLETGPGGSRPSSLSHEDITCKPYLSSLSNISMSRQLAADHSRSIKRADHSHPLTHRRSLQAKLQSPSNRLSPYSRPSPQKSSSRAGSSAGGSPRPFFLSDDATESSGEDDLGSKHIPGIKLPVPTLAMSGRKTSRTYGGSSKRATRPASAKKDRSRGGERKASVRKERFEELDTDSDLTDVPSEDDDSNEAGPSRSRVEKGKARSFDDLDSDIDDENDDSDTEMERKLAEAGDGESLLGSGVSGDDTEEEEERFIIQDAAERESRARSRLQQQHRDSSDRKRHGDERDWASRGDTQHRARSIAIRDGADGMDRFDAHDADGDADNDDDDHGDDEELLSMSPNTLRMYGLPVIDDEIFEEQEAFNSSSEPSFTDFFESSTDSDMADVELASGQVDDDDEFTTDSDEDHDISDLDEGVLDAPLIAHIGTAQVPVDGESAEGIANTAANEIEAKPEMPLLVIEDLDGRLIYARAGDGEAVFGSDGEFEFVDDSDDDSADWEYDGGGNRLWGPSVGQQGLLGLPEDDGDTTDELPDEDMPYPRLLVGSVAPRGGRNARRARAMAAQSRRLSPSGHSALPSPSTHKDPQLAQDGVLSAANSTGSGSRGSPNSIEEQQLGSSGAADVGITISTAELARDPEGTLRAAAEALGVTVEEAATLVAGVQIPGVGTTLSAEDPAAPTSQPAAGAFPKTPEQPRIAQAPRPQMGRFMPTSAKAVHRAVIDGSRKAPSPFSGRRSLEKKGLAKKRSASRRSSLTGDFIAKRLRRFSSTNDAASTIDEVSEAAPSSPELEAVDPMELDDVVDADMIWRGTQSKSPSPDLDDADGERDDVDGGARRTSSARGKRRSSSAAPGLNLNAFARWHKIPMGSFRDSQASPSQAQNAFQHQQPLGTFLLTRSQGSSANKRTSSPFRSSSNAVRDPEMFSISPLRHANVHAPGEVTTIGGEGSSTGRKRSFVISPVLFPKRGGEIPPPSSLMASSLSAMGSNTNTRAHLGINSTAFETGSVASNNSAGPGRITRREKREKRARRAAMLAGHAEADETDSQLGEGGRSASKSPRPTTPLLQTSSLASLGVPEDSDSPASAFPRMRITDATPTPRGSPAPSGPPATGKDLLQPLSGLNPNSQPPSTPVSTNAALVEMGHVFTPEHATGSGEHDLANSSGITGALPSSACKTPLHSPLFGGIFGGALGYDLEEKEGEQLRI